MNLSDKVKRIQSIAEKKIHDIEILEFQKYNKLFSQAVKFLKKEKVLMYGGSAINDLMPKKLKFYEPMSLPDIDIFALNAEQVAARIVKRFEDKGYQYCGFKEALHENTYKVFVEGMQILDITNITPQIYKKLSKGRVKGEHGLYVTNPEYLRMTLHTLMSLPFNAYRWPKVYKRLVYFYKTFPMKKCTTIEKVNMPKIDDRVTTLFCEWARKHGYVFFGGPEVMEYIPFDSGDRRDIFVADDDLVKVAQDFLLQVPDDIRQELDMSISKLVPDDDMFVADHIFITSKGRRIFGIYKTDYCLSYVNIGGNRIASFHTLCNMYMALYLAYPSDRVKCVVNSLGTLQSALIKKPSRKKIFDQFVLECYGPFETQATLRRKHMERIMKQQEMKM